uniref:Uncharacterized protein n=1 Tax=Avena sativa TaxID=4498 RepID=A0ACD5X4J2_AVESA
MSKHSLPLLVAVAAIVLSTTVAAQAPAPASVSGPASAPASVSAPALAPATAPGNCNSTIKPTAYEMVKRYDFPPGILPEGAQSYVIRRDGSFQVNFPYECHFRVAKYTVRYSTRVAGTIKNGSISGLQGVKVKILFGWMSIRDVGRHGDALRLKAGPISQSFPVDDFSVSPRCN